MHNLTGQALKRAPFTPEGFPLVVWAYGALGSAYSRTGGAPVQPVWCPSDQPVGESRKKRAVGDLDIVKAAAATPSM